MPPHIQSASLRVAARPFAVDAKVEVTLGGLLGITALVCGILLASAVVVQAAKK